MRPLGFAVLIATGLLAAPAVAHADGFISPTVGVNFGGQAGGTLVNCRRNSAARSTGASPPAGWAKA